MDQYVKKYIVSLDPGTGFVRPRKEWVTIEAGTAHEAALLFAAAQAKDLTTFTVDVVLLAQFEKSGWDGCICHTLDVIRQRPAISLVGSKPAATP